MKIRRMSSCSRTSNVNDSAIFPDKDTTALGFGSVRRSMAAKFVIDASFTVIIYTLCVITVNLDYS